MSRKQAKGSKTTFWNDIRVKSGMLVSDVAELMHVSLGKAGAWFSGQNMPRDAEVQALCELFGVDPIQGYNEFVKARNEWRSARGNQKFELRGPEVPGTTKKAKADKRGRSKKVTETPDIPQEPIIVVDEIPETPSATEFYKEVLRYFYGKIPYPLYLDLMVFVAEKKDLVAELYGKLKFDDYAQLLHIWRTHNAI